MEEPTQEEIDLEFGAGVLITRPAFADMVKRIEE